MAPFRFVRLATLCALMMCCAGALQLSGGGDASASTPDIRFKSETFPLERITAITVRLRT
jgi:hypothetical protein